MCEKEESEAFEDFLVGFETPVEMASGNGENVAGSLKRPHPGNGATEIASRIFEGGGGDVSEESLLTVQKEVLELAEKVAEYREKGPVAFAHLLEKSLVQMRSSLPSMDTHVNDKPTDTVAEVDDQLASSEKEVLEQRKKVLERFAAAKESLPAILRDIQSCQERLAAAIAARRQSLDRDLPLTPGSCKVKS